MTRRRKKGWSTLAAMNMIRAHDQRATICVTRGRVNINSNVCGKGRRAEQSKKVVSHSDATQSGLRKEE